MSLNNHQHPDLDPEDYFQESRMSFGDHIEDLRSHLLRAIYGFLIMLVGSFFISSYVLELIGKPVEEQLNEFYNRRVERVKKKLLAGNDPDTERINAAQEIALQFSREELSKRLGLQIADNNPFLTDDGQYLSLTVRIRPLEIALVTAEAQRVVGRRPTLATLRVEEGFMVYFKVSLLTAFVLGSPWIFYQLWAFVAAGLYAHEKRYVNVYLPFSIGLFLGGVALAQFLVIPKAIEALLWFNEWLGLEPELRLNDWLGFALMMPLLTGISFQTPLVMLFLEKMGILSVEVFARARRIAWFVLLVIAAVFSPTVDAVSLFYLWIPLVLLYELGIWLCRLSPRVQSPFDESDTKESHEMIEV